jgi:hypothetical protein
MSNADATETRIRIGRNGAKVHRANLDGNTYCGSQSARSRQGVTFLPAATAVTCSKCDPAAAAAAPAPVTDAPTHTRCEKVVYGEVCGNRYRIGSTCAMCD